MSLRLHLVINPHFPGSYPRTHDDTHPVGNAAACRTQWTNLHPNPRLLCWRRIFLHLHRDTGILPALNLGSLLSNKESVLCRVSYKRCWTRFGIPEVRLKPNTRHKDVLANLETSLSLFVPLHFPNHTFIRLSIWNMNNIQQCVPAIQSRMTFGTLPVLSEVSPVPCLHATRIVYWACLLGWLSNLLFLSLKTLSTRHFHPLSYLDK